MRDDLHKKAPIPRKAQKVLKLALREADRNHPERLRAAACSALEEFVAQNFSPSILRAIADAQEDLFGLAPASTQARSPAESEFFASIWQGTKTEIALEAALRGVSESFSRESRATLIAEGVPDTPTVIGAFSAALHKAGVEVARAVCSGGAISDASRPLSLSENLLAPKRGATK